MEKSFGLLETFSISRVRRNHGLEHATLNILSERYPRLRMAGHSDANGFWIVADLPVAEVSQAVEQALARMQSGEENLAIHANCGTNFVAAGTAAGIAAWLGMLGAGKGLRGKLERLPLVISLATIALVVAQPLGFILQARVTTSGQPGALEIEDIYAARQGGFPACRVVTRG